MVSSVTGSSCRDLSRMTRGSANEVSTRKDPSSTSGAGDGGVSICVASGVGDDGASIGMVSGASIGVDGGDCCTSIGVDGVVGGGKSIDGICDMHIQVEERVFSSIPDSSACLGSALVAGDSNVHRIQAAIPNWSTIRCLPVSASSRRVTEVCDSIHATSPETEIVLCSILPRKKNNRRVSSTLARVFNRWIQNANTMLMDISEAILYIRFLGYGAQKSTKSSRSQPNSKSTISTSSLNPVEKTSPPHQDELDIADHADFSKLKLLLSNDVEQNPGPTYHCEWNNCGFIGLTTTTIGQHLRQHGREEECKWAQCNGFQRTSYEDLELHIIHDHFFDRSKLKLLLFDEDYLDMPTNKSYTMSDHLCTLDFEISILPFSSTSTAKTYYPDLNAVQCEVLEIPALERPSKKRKSTASVKVTKYVEPLSVMQESKKSMYEQFSIDLIEDGKIYIQVAEEDTMICCMNDFNDSGSLRKEVYVYTTWLKQESGDYFHCTCSIYRTLFDIAHSQTLNYSNRNSCMHCTFLKCIVLPNLQIDERATDTKTRKFVQEGKQCAGKDLIELSDFNGTRKFSVLAEGETKPVFLSLSYNKARANYTVTFHNGEFQSKKGHKRYLNNLNSSNLCRHLCMMVVMVILISVRAAIQQQLERVIKKKKKNMLRRNIIKRDGWNDLTLSRQADGSLKGPNFYPDMPDNTCCCGSGWLKRDDDPDYSENGKLIPLGRVLTVYIQFAPVQCDVYKRVCYNPIDDNRCELALNEGQSESIHVFSSTTAAGDEIGWEFTSSVMKTGCTFSAYCQMKDELYRTRDPKANWAANMNIDFRQPCDICRYEPNRLCFDGTREGVGFRHSNFTEISTPDRSLQTQQTLHRRMDRCYLKNKPGVEKRQMIAYREALDNIARTTVAEFEPLDIPENNDRINLLMQALPEEAHQSFQRFTRGMSEFERVAYGSVLKMLATTASVTSILSTEYALFLQEFLTNENLSDFEFNRQMYEMRSFAPEIRDLIAESMLNNNNILPDDIKLFLVHFTNESLNLPVYAPEDATFQFGTYNPEKLGRAYYFNEHGVKLRNMRTEQAETMTMMMKLWTFERCRKIYSKIQQSAPGTSNLFLWFCPDHGHCYGFHMTVAEGRKDPSASLYSHLAKPQQAVFYDFACNLQEYCLNRESGYSHKCSTSFRSSRLQGFESVNSEICEQFNSFIQILKKSARQMTQSHFCFYLQFFIHEWNRRKRVAYKRKISTELAGLL
ncbi:hypothetical protein MAR_033087 [Mya arenaria]|uniref:C2H2-type domain-containing protein n=1 Tax=Mya arenaria TaxID=6604 RepID=A0ABY7G7Z9_MYAAR|nr:hypothetical protein MAR_033087 [Mya arenaria]